MSWLFLTLLQQGAVATIEPPPSALPDIELRATIEAREVEIDVATPIAVRVTGAAQPGDGVEVRRNQSTGRTSYRNLQIDARIAAHLIGPEPALSAETRTQLHQGEQENEPQD